MTITHVVSLKYKDSIPEEERLLAFERFLHLKTSCKLPPSESKGEGGGGGNYILDLIAGKENLSPERLDKGFHQTFVLTFKDEKDLFYYLEQDEDHKRFSSMVANLLEDVFVFDFKSG
ncbi:hypothetical protein IE53DRAFT_386888 [Violaceomyces palustris]|uniref:Uncharacterized protein n=1 Tax=Violaceomyces palustris TaxID=1673888 RepID=A0ACD0NYC2_9BASI|nr:hypothetical protein IE53DRAFT_386888 [Violaceomyces palustris]